MAKSIQTRPLYEVAMDIKRDWKNVYFGAKPYLDAMQTLNSINDYYIMEKADMIVRYFLANASTWRGEKARQIKKELKLMIGMK